MRIYLDTANPSLWTLPEGAPTVYGVTTNPTLVHRAGYSVTLKTYRFLVDQAGEKRISEIMLQAVHPDPSELRAWLDELLPAAAINRTKLVIKVPCHPEWRSVINALRDADVPFLLTGLSNPVQLLWARAVGADFVAPYLGRIEAKGQSPWPLVEACIRMQDSGVKLVAASIKSVETLSRLIALGSYSVTLQPSFIEDLIHDEITNEAILQFERDTQESLRDS
jgi:transaldolase